MRKTFFNFGFILYFSFLGFSQNPPIVTENDINKAIDAIISPTTSNKEKESVLSYFIQEGIKLSYDQNQRLMEFFPKASLAFAIKLFVFQKKILTEKNINNELNEIFLKRILNALDNYSVNNACKPETLISSIRLFREKPEDLKIISEKCLVAMRKDKNNSLLKKFLKPLNQEKINSALIELKKMDPLFKREDLDTTGPYIPIFSSLISALADKKGQGLIELLFQRISELDEAEQIEALNLFIEKDFFMSNFKTPYVPVLIKLNKSKSEKTRKVANILLEKIFLVKTKDWEHWWDQQRKNFNSQKYFEELIFNEKVDKDIRLLAIENYFGLFSKNKKNPDVKRFYQYVTNSKNNDDVRMNIAFPLCGFLPVERKVKLAKTLYNEKNMQIVALSIVYVNSLKDDSLTKDIVNDFGNLQDKPKTFTRYAIMALNKLSGNKKDYAKVLLNALLKIPDSENIDAKNKLIEALTGVVGENHGVDFKAWKKAIDDIP